MRGKWGRRLLSLGVWLTLAGMLCACAGDPPAQDSVSSENSVETVASSEGSSYSEDVDSSEPLFFEKLSYASFCETYPDYQGKWELKELCAKAKIVGDLYIYLSENAPGAVLDVTADGIGILDARYMLPETRLHRETKREFCVEGGYLDWDGVPLSDTGLHEIFHFITEESEGIRFFTLCLYEQDKLLVGLDDNLYFIAERAE